MPNQHGTGAASNRGRVFWPYEHCTSDQYFDQTAMLLERCVPGTALRFLPEYRVTRIWRNQPILPLPRGTRARQPHDDERHGRDLAICGAGCTHAAVTALGP